ncbi:hypothetical protein KAI10_02955, partial [Candidatus Bathyarchaeota archaeon]|nr:hypothetical protein [Candidatus Bathyarchaeota archaeon]
QNKPTTAQKRHASSHQDTNTTQTKKSMGQETATLDIKLTLTPNIRITRPTPRRIRINPEEKRREYLDRLETLLQQLSQIVTSKETPMKHQLKAMDSLIKTIKNCLEIITDIEIEELEDELQKIEEETTKTKKDLGYTIQEDPVK